MIPVGSSVRSIGELSTITPPSPVPFSWLVALDPVESMSPPEPEAEGPIS